MAYLDSILLAAPFIIRTSMHYIVIMLMIFLSCKFFAAIAHVSFSVFISFCFVLFRFILSQFSIQFCVDLNFISCSKMGAAWGRIGENKSFENWIGWNGLTKKKKKTFKININKYTTQAPYSSRDDCITLCILSACLWPFYIQFVQNRNFTQTQTAST